ncbi:hypothetical protein GCM10008955_01580 [Deinococcus malanensis]|uniref:Uncharacterized protein n=1 Tax=Deinococcus malanensis TaxID=1706855 RepID=A0ABQ2EHJ8_9DEIO|nr:hypothetical protein GCM10008955_01580 [Deinococcus malanensis]
MPGDWTTVPEGVKELERYLSDKCGGTLVIQSTPAALRCPLVLPVGVWAPGTWLMVRKTIELMLIPRAFFSLGWMEEVT